MVRKKSPVKTETPPADGPGAGPSLKPSRARKKTPVKTPTPPADAPFGGEPEVVLSPKSGRGARIRPSAQFELGQFWRVRFATGPHGKTWYSFNLGEYPRMEVRANA